MNIVPAEDGGLGRSGSFGGVVFMGSGLGPAGRPGMTARPSQALALVGILR
jgi:hypothetical protein